MSTDITRRMLLSFPVPASIARCGEAASRRYIEFLTASIRNKGTRIAYAHAINTFFAWCDEFKLDFHDVEPLVIATYIEGLGARLAAR